jgi:general secretion pathway protein K
MNGPHKSKGVALITALLIVALATVAATSFATQQQLDIRRTGNLIDGDQAWAYAEGGEAWAKLILQRDTKDDQQANSNPDDQQANSATDDLTEPWAQPLPPIKLVGGYMIGRITDAQARLNLNNLVIPDPNAEDDTTLGTSENPQQVSADADIGENPQQVSAASQVNGVALNQLQRLLIELELDPNLAHAVIDWMDGDINPHGAYGAEDDYYSRLKHPYRTANQKMVSVSELRLVKGFNEKAYQRVAPFLTALPIYTPINVNTAPAEVLATLPNMDAKAAIALTKLRQENPFKDTKEFGDALSTVGGVPQGQDTAVTGVDVKTQFFDVTVNTRIGYGRASLVSLLSREEQGDIKTVWRAQGVL